jgi:meso-butanediol dehydrogenase/(S,S)-butanediol dehydrogenase/diacetyl reductase
MTSKRLDGKSCIVTGAATGIGRGIAIRLANEGADICIADLNEEGGKNVVSEIEAAGGKAIASVVDVAERSLVRQMVESTVDAFGRLDVIFNNAGLGEIKPFMKITENDWNAMMHVNGLGVLICMQEAARHMIAQGEGGTIVNTASIAGREGYHVQPHYSASKFAVVALTQAGARAFGEYNIRVNAFGPGVVETNIWEKIDKEFIEHGLFKKPGDAMKAFSSRVLLGGRPSTPDDIVGLAAFLASDDSNYITGQTIMVDGGMVMW